MRNERGCNPVPYIVNFFRGMKPSSTLEVVENSIETKRTESVPKKINITAQSLDDLPEIASITRPWPLENNNSEIIHSVIDLNNF